VACPCVDESISSQCSLTNPAQESVDPSTRPAPLARKSWSTHPPPNLLTTRCTIGISFPLTLYTTTSPIFVSRPLFHKNNRSPLQNAGSIDSESTTTMGDGESAATERPFQSMKAVERMRAKLRTCAASWRGWRVVRAENILNVGLGRPLEDRNTSRLLRAIVVRATEPRMSS